MSDLRRRLDDLELRIRARLNRGVDVDFLGTEARSLTDSGWITCDAATQERLGEHNLVIQQHADTGKYRGVWVLPQGQPSGADLRYL